MPARGMGGSESLECAPWLGWFHRHCVPHAASRAATPWGTRLLANSRVQKVFLAALRCRYSCRCCCHPGCALKRGTQSRRLPRRWSYTSASATSRARWAPPHSAPSPPRAFFCSYAHSDDLHRLCACVRACLWPQDVLRPRQSRVCSTGPARTFGRPPPAASCRPLDVDAVHGRSAQAVVTAGRWQHACSPTAPRSSTSCAPPIARLLEAAAAQLARHRGEPVPL